MTKILIVEDDESIRYLYTLKLQLAGYEVVGAENGEIGFKKAEQQRPNLILLDIRMPVMSDDEMLQRLRAEEWGSHIRVIVLTNISKDEAPLSLRLLNVDRYVVKAHHTPKQLLEIVNSVLS